MSSAPRGIGGRILNSFERACQRAILGGLSAGAMNVARSAARLFTRTLDRQAANLGSRSQELNQAFAGRLHHFASVIHHAERPRLSLDQGLRNPPREVTTGRVIPGKASGPQRFLGRHISNDRSVTHPGCPGSAQLVESFSAMGKDQIQPSALRALRHQDEGVRSTPRLGFDATPNAPPPMNRVWPHRAIRRPWQRRPGRRKSPGCASRGFLVQWSSRFWRVVIAVTLRGAGRFAQRCRSNNLQL